MTPFYTDPLVTLHLGDCLEVMAELPDASVDAVVTDPPYGLEFMGKDWDSFAPQETTGRVRRKEGSIRMSEPDAKYGGTRVNYPSPSRPMKCALCGGWSGKFDASKAKRQKQCLCETPRFVSKGASSQMRAYQTWSEAWAREAFRVLKPGGHLLAFGGTRTVHRLAAAIEDAGFEIRDMLLHIYASGFPKSHSVEKALRADGNDELADKYAGFGTAMKPATEPIVMARKPLVGTVAGNVARFGTGALNIGASRIPGTEAQKYTVKRLKPGATLNKTGGNWRPEEGGVEYHGETQAGRWPSNVMLSDPELFDSPNPEVVGSGAVAGDFTQGRYHLPERSAPDAMFAGGRLDAGNTYTDTGGYSRFFLVPKAPVTERMVDGQRGTHPTQKPVDLMRHLLKLVTPPGGVALDPFGGSGTTAVAASLEGMRCILIEREEEYIIQAKGRLIATPMGLGLDVGAPVRKAPKTHPDLSKHQPKRRSPSTNWSGPWAGNEHLHRFPADSQVCDCGVTAAEFYNQEPAA